MLMVATPSGKVIHRLVIDGELAKEIGGLYMKEDVPSFSAVAVFGAVGDWAAYAGPTSWTDEWLADRGTKLHELEAIALFPFMNVSAYRR